MSAASTKSPAKYLFDVEFGGNSRFGDLSGNARAAIAEQCGEAPVAAHTGRDGPAVR